ncbi:hypothetical protein DKG71_00470 [Streptomyces sp. NEAU-S7GS2]|nr:hypothetical protein DKG71_00470 [Streptomyces sp. NEAU-S7GS2]
MRLDAQSAHLEPDPVIVMIQPDTLSVFGPFGQLCVGDAVEKAVREAGGQPLRFPVVFGPERARGWKAQLKLKSDHLLIHHPSGSVFYDGSMPTEARWRADVAATGDVVVITGPIANVANIEPVLAQGLATWVRIPLAQTK